MAGLLLRWMGGGGGDTICQMLAMDNPDTYMNFSVGDLDKLNGRTLIKNDRDSNYPLLSLVSMANPIDDKEKLRDDFVKLISKHKKFIIKFHNFDKEFDELLKNHLNVSDVGFNLGFLPFIIQSNFEKFSNTQHPMYDLKYKSESNFNTMLEKIGRKLNTHQKNQVLLWNMITEGIKCMYHFNLDKAPLSTEDLFYDNKRIESFFEDYGYKINFAMPFFSAWKNKNKRYLPSAKYKNYLQNNTYNYDDKNLSMVERYIFLSLAGKSFTFLG